MKEPVMKNTKKWNKFKKECTKTMKWQERNKKMQKNTTEILHKEISKGRVTKTGYQKVRIDGREWKLEDKRKYQR